MKIYLGVTDNNWFSYLSKILPEDINFWQPGGNANFKVLSPGAPFIFKLKSPLNKIGGVGFFSSQTFLPINIAWDVFEERNGCGSFEQFRQMILQYRTDKENLNPTIGCIVLTNPVFFKQEDWIDVPEDWSKSIVQGKSYDTTAGVGLALWQKVEMLLNKYLSETAYEGEKSQLILEDTESPKYGSSILKKVRLGQGAFRVLVTDAYTRRCSITGEKTLPVLEAAHIKPYSKSGPHFISNGLLLRSDLHKLFDAGYITVTKDYKVEVSKSIREEFQNGKEYYQYHGKDLVYLPARAFDRPNEKYIEWHNSIFKG
ncbi:MAG TPA: HNH endonuclease [Flavisolibacter sp.]|jgi:putative restriction endonuclease|nr:HNH endonuclease [Flavisolibacter sp.]